MVDPRASPSRMALDYAQNLADSASEMLFGASAPAPAAAPAVEFEIRPDPATPKRRLSAALAPAAKRLERSIVADKLSAHVEDRPPPDEIKRKSFDATKHDVAPRLRAPARRLSRNLAANAVSAQLCANLEEGGPPEVVARSLSAGERRDAERSRARRPSGLLPSERTTPARPTPPKTIEDGHLRRRGRPSDADSSEERAADGSSVAAPPRAPRG